MANYIRSWMTFIVTAASIIIMVPAACSSPVPPRNISQAEQTAETMDPGDCLPNQFLSLITFTCENCTFCPQGTEHSPNKHCGNGWGVETTCTPCAKGYFQMGEAYTGLVCSRCVTCDPTVKYLQNCTTTQNARCGPCPTGNYYLYPNICVGCKNDPSHNDCQQLTTIKPSTASSPNQSAPTTTSVDTTLSPLSSPAHNTTNDYDKGSPIKKFSVFGIIAIVTVIVICVISLACLAYKKWKATDNSASENELPSKTATFPNAAYEDLPQNDSMTPTNDEGSSVRSSQSEIQGEIAEESAAPAPEAETTAPTSANTPLDDEQLQGTSNPVNQSSASLSTEVLNIDLSLPGELSSYEGAGDGAWYHANHGPRSLEDKDTSDDDEDGSMSRPKSLKSKSLLSN
eukprot:XP_011668632.1 PREDICTED: uncharacterized protein LOC752882 isoform X2 [Strongylocentrotus purpuratus]